MQAHSGTFDRPARIKQTYPSSPRPMSASVHPAQTPRYVGEPLAAYRNAGLVHRAALALVWLSVAVSGIVFTEPAPTDALAIGLVVLLPAIGLVAISPLLILYLSLWLIAAGAAFLAAAMAPDISPPAMFTLVSLYLYVASFVMAAFVARSPSAHADLVFRAWVVAGLGAAATAIAGYFELFAGAYDLFTRFGRATGTFKDPNVYGPFLVAPFLYTLHLAIDRPLSRIALPLAISAILALGLFLSFSRGAWFNLALALLLYAGLAYITAGGTGRRRRIVQLIATGAILAAIMVAAALQSDRVVDLLAERATLTQSYDVGPEGRFGGQEKALALIGDNPLGIGATVFSGKHHPEEVHNVYLSMMLNAGWLGGAIYLLLTLLTITLGLAHALRFGGQQPLFLVAYAAFVANAFEGLIIDIDHWRHVYLLMAIVWGAMSAARHRVVADLRQWS